MIEEDGKIALDLLSCLDKFLMDDRLIYVTNILMQKDWEKHPEQYASLITSLASHDYSCLPLKVKNLLKMIPFSPAHKMNILERGKLVNQLYGLNALPTHEMFLEWLLSIQ